MWCELALNQPQCVLVNQWERIEMFTWHSHGALLHPTCSDWWAASLTNATHVNGEVPQTPRNCVQYHYSASVNCVKTDSEEVFHHFTA